MRRRDCTPSSFSLRLRSKIWRKSCSRISLLTRFWRNLFAVLSPPITLKLWLQGRAPGESVPGFCPTRRANRSGSAEFFPNTSKQCLYYCHLLAKNPLTSTGRFLPDVVSVFIKVLPGSGPVSPTFIASPLAHVNRLTIRIR